MLKNIGRSLRVLALVLAGLCFAAFAAFGTLCLICALGEGVDEALKTAGLQAACISFALALLTPFLQLVTYGLGVLIETAQAQAQDSKRVREILQASLADGLLSDEIARKYGVVFTKILPQIQMQAPTATTGAPVQRPVAQPSAPAPQAVVEEERPAEEDEVCVEKLEKAPVAAQPAAPVKPQVQKTAPVKPAPVKPTPAKPLTPNGAWRTLEDDMETF